MTVDNLRKRAKGKLIKVTFPSGKVICYKNVTNTFLGVLREVGSERFPEVKLELCHLPLLSKEIYPRYKEWMKPVCDGWYLNAQSNTDQKYLQLRSLNDSLGLGLEIEIGEDFETQKVPDRISKSKTKDNLLVRFPDGEYIASQSTIETFTQTIWEIGIDQVMRKGIDYAGSPLITTRQENNRQVQIGPDRWIKVPNTTKEKAKLLRIIAIYMHINLEITIV
ncbi:MAG: hypothetical protein ACI30D_01770 [Muribaculaceae bacterium]